jgi:spermidine synthase
VVGLGAGTLAIYGQHGDTFTFYEIDPLVVQLASSEFSYLKASRAKVVTVVGDGRLSLERERQRKFELLAVDAFSGDAIPYHLLTYEAFRLYFSRLKPGGVVAVHITNRYLDLKRVLAKVAEAMGAGAILIHTEYEASPGAYESDWVLLNADREAFRDVARNVASPLAPAPAGFRLWTDDYSNVLAALR